MRRALKAVGVGLLLALGVGGAWAAYQWPALSAFPALPSGYEAKELCSCLFVEGRPQAECEAFIRQTVVPIDGRSYDMAEKTVSVTALWTTRRARWISERHGCALVAGGG